MADNDVKIKLSLDGDKLVIDGLKGVGDGATEADSKLGSFVSGGLKGASVALVGLAAAGTAAGVALSAAVISAYADAEQSVGGIETLFGDSADKMKAYATNAYATAGLSANEYMEQATSMSASLIQSVGGDTAKAAELANTALVAMSDNANKMGTDLSAIQDAFGGFAKGNYTMLDNLKLGYGGTQAEMERLLADAEQLPSAMGQKFDLSNYGDIVTAIQLVQEEMGIAGTTALEAGTTISGSVGMLKGSFDNLLVAMGSANNESLAFLDVQEQAANVINSLETVVGNVAPVIESLGGALSTLGPQLGGMLEGLVGTVSAVIPGLLEAGVAMIGGLVQGISSALPALITALVPGLIGLVEMVVTQLPLLIDAGLQAIAALAQGVASALPTLIPLLVEGLIGMVEAIISNLPLLLEAGLQIITGLAEGLLAALPVLIAALPGLIISLVDFIVSAIPQIMEAGIQLLLGLVGALPEIITGLVAAIPQIVTGILDAVIGAIPMLIQGGIELLMGLIGALPQIIIGIVQAIPQIISGVLNAVVGAIPQLIDAGVQLLVALVQNIGPITSQIVQAIPQIISGIVGAIGGSVGAMAQAGGDLIRGLWQGISDTVGWLMDKIGGFVDDVVSGIKSFFGIASPSRLFRDEIGKMLVAGTGIGITANADLVLNPVEDLNKALTVEAKKISRLELAPAVGLGQNAVASPQAMPITYTTMPTILASQTVTLDTRQMRTILEDIVASGIAAQDIDINNNISMYDRDPRIVGKQLGRTVKGVLVG